MQDLTSVPTAPPFCILLAGGQGSRLHELTLTECKPAVAFRGGRLVDFTMANALHSGLEQVMVATQYRPEGLIQHLEQCWHPRFRHGLQIRDGRRLCAGEYTGTADAVRANLPEILASGARELLILSADHVYRMDYRPMLARHRATGAKITVAVDKVTLDQARGFGVMSAGPDGEITAFHEKPLHPQPAPDDPTRALVSLGIYVVDIAWLAGALAGRGMDDFGHDVLPEAVAQGVAWVHRAAEAAQGAFYWRDVGTLTSYRQTLLDFLSPETAPFPPPMALPLPGRDEQQAAARGTVLMPGARIAGRARVSNAILGPGAVVPDGLVIGDNPDDDRRWFRVIGDGTVLVTPAMLARRREDCQRPAALDWCFASAMGR